MTSKQRVDALNPISFKEELEQAMDDHAEGMAIGFAKWCQEEQWMTANSYAIKYSNPIQRMEQTELYKLYLKSLK